MLATDESETVAEVSAAGTRIGCLPAAVALQSPGVLHYGASLQLVDASARFILARTPRSQRAFADRWAPTLALHPEDVPSSRQLVREAGQARLALGNDIEVFAAGRVLFRCEDSLTGDVEHELHDVFVAVIENALRCELGGDRDFKAFEMEDVLQLIASDECVPWLGSTVHRVVVTSWDAAIT